MDSKTKGKRKDILVDKVFARNYGVIILRPLHMHTVIKQLNECMMEGESQVSQCWIGGLHISKEKVLK